MPCCCLLPLPPFWLTCTSTLLSPFSCAADATASERALPADANPCAGLAALQARTGRRAAGERRLAIVNGAAAISLLYLGSDETPRLIRLLKIVGRTESLFWLPITHCLCLRCALLSWWQTVDQRLLL